MIGETRTITLRLALVQILLCCVVSWLAANELVDILIPHRESGLSAYGALALPVLWAATFGVTSGLLVWLVVTPARYVLPAPSPDGVTVDPEAEWDQDRLGVSR